MKTFNIEIIETLSRIVEIKAISSEEAIALAKDMYQSEIIVLDANDFIDVNIFDNSK